LFTPEEAAEQYQIREQRIQGIKSKFIQWGYLEEPYNYTDFLEAILRYLSMTSSITKVVNLDDLLGSNIQINLPGTTKEYPNWRHRLLVNLDDLEIKIQRMEAIFRK